MEPYTAMKIADGIEVLDIVMDVGGRRSIIHPTVLWDDGEVILVDAGIPGSLAGIRSTMNEAGTSFDALSKVVLTHQDIDHIGGVPEILHTLGYQVEVLAHAADKPYMEGDKPLLKMNPERLAKLMESWPEAQRSRMQALLDHPITVKVDRTISDGEVLPTCGGITVIATPGHTPGHISLYHHLSKTLIAGDALVVVDGKLLGPSPQTTADMPTALESAKKFGKYDIDTVICYHGGVYNQDVNQRLAELTGSGQGGR